MSENIPASESEKKAARKALDFLLVRMRTEKELMKRLADVGFSQQDIEYALEYVKSFGYINDRAYAEQYISSRSAQKGRALLKMELREKGVSDEIIGDALELIPEDNSEVLHSLIIKKAGEPHKLDEKENRRLFAFLSRRGFSASDIIRALRSYESGSL